MVYIYDLWLKCIYPVPKHELAYHRLGSYVILGDVGINGPSQGELEYILISKGWSQHVPFPTLEEDPVPF